jgi:hypothetical protein
MNSRETLTILASLTREESFVLFWKLQGKSHKQISDKIGLSEDRVQQFSTSCYRKFGLSGRQWNQLRDKTHITMAQVAHSTEWINWEWPTKQLLDKLSESEDQPIQQQAQPQRPLQINWRVPWQDQVKEIALNKTYQLLAFGVLILLVVGIIIGNRFFHTPPAQNTPTETIRDTPAVFPNSTVTLIHPSPTNQAIATTTSTPEPTSTPAPTSTATITSTPENVFVLHDFSNGLGPFEAADLDKITIVNGLFTGGGWISIPCDLKNFQIEVKGTASTTGTGTGIYVAPAYIDPMNNILFRTNYLEREWRHRENNPSGWELSGTSISPLDPEMTIIVTVIDSNIEIKINGVNMSSAFNNKVEFGRIGFYAEHAGIKSIKIIELP